MPAASKPLTFIPFIPRYSELQRKTPRPPRDIIRAELRNALDAKLAAITGIPDMCMCYSTEEYARVIIWCLGWALDGWPWHIPFTNLSNIKGGVKPLRLLKDLWLSGALRFVKAPPDVRARALHNPESVLPHVLAAAALPPLPLTARGPKYNPENFRHLLTSSGHAVHCVPKSAPPTVQELVLHPNNLEPVLTLPLGLESSQPHERRQHSDVNKARARPISNPAGKPSHSRKIGALTSLYVLDQGPAAAQSAKPMKPLSEHPLPLLTSEHIGDYVEVDGEGAEEEEIESWSDSEVSGAA